MPNNMPRIAIDPIYIDPYAYLPERGLLAGVLRRAVLDLWYSSTRSEAIHWFLDRKSYFKSKRPWMAIGFLDCIDWLGLSASQVRAIEMLVEAAKNKTMPEGGYNGKCYTEGKESREGSCQVTEQPITWVQRKAYSAVLRDGRYQ